MPRTRDGFVPLGDVSQAVALPGDRALTHRADASPARRPFTRLDQVMTRPIFCTSASERVMSQSGAVKLVLRLRQGL